jgi:voltage-gated potassium channel
MPKATEALIPRSMLPAVQSRFFWLLVSLITFILFSGEFGNTDLGLFESAGTMVLILLVVVFATRAGNGRRILMACMCAVLLSGWVANFFHPVPAVTIVCFVGLIACLCLSVLWTLEFVLGTGSVGIDHILGAVCAYVMIAMIFATVYTVQWYLDKAAFKGIEHDTARPWVELFYFSFTTLTTVGYGDIVPASLKVRSVSIVEQLTGTFYIAILIARLTSLYGPRSEAAELEDGGDS